MLLRHTRTQIRPITSFTLLPSPFPSALPSPPGRILWRPSRAASPLPSNRPSRLGLSLPPLCCVLPPAPTLRGLIRLCTFFFYCACTHGLTAAVFSHPFNISSRGRAAPLPPLPPLSPSLPPPFPLVSASLVVCRVVRHSLSTLSPSPSSSHCFSALIRHDSDAMRVHRARSALFLSSHCQPQRFAGA